MSARGLVNRWMPVIAWMAVIFFASTDWFSAEHTSRFLTPLLRWLYPQISLATIAAVHVTVRKLGHVTEYGILAMLLWRALRAPSLREMSKTAGIALVVAAGYAAFDEFHQSFVASRTASEIDVLIDICGAIVGVMICLLFARSKDRQRGPERI